MKTIKMFVQFSIIGGLLFSLSGCCFLGIIGSCGKETTPAPQVQSAPVVSAAAGDGQVTLTWSAVVNATSYDIYRSTAPDAETNGVKIISVAASPYVDTGKTNGTTYYYVVVAVNSSSSWNAWEVSATPAPRYAYGRVTTFKSVNDTLSDGTNLYLVGSNSSDKLRVEKRSMSDLNTVIWFYEPDIYCEGVVDYWYVVPLCRGTLSTEDSQPVVYLTGISYTDWLSEGVLEKDLAWEISKISDAGILIWNQKSNEVLDFTCEYPVGISVDGFAGAVYISGLNCFANSGTNQRIEKRNSANGELIWEEIYYSMNARVFVTGTNIYNMGFIDLVISDDYVFFLVVEAIDGSGNFLWRKEDDAVSTGKSLDVLPNAAGIYGDSLFIGVRIQENAATSILEKRSIADGSLIKSISGVDVSAIVIGDAVYATGKTSLGNVIQKYDFNLNLLWSVSESAAALVKVGDYLYITDASNIVRLSAIDGSRQ